MPANTGRFLYPSDSGSIYALVLFSHVEAAPSRLRRRLSSGWIGEKGEIALWHEYVGMREIRSVAIEQAESMIAMDMGEQLCARSGPVLFRPHANADRA